MTQNKGKNHSLDPEKSQTCFFFDEMTFGTTHEMSICKF